MNKLKISSAIVQKIINKLELDRTFTSLGELWGEVAKEYNLQYKDNPVSCAKIRCDTYKFVLTKTRSAKPAHMVAGISNVIKAKLDRDSLSKLESYVKVRDPKGRWAKTVKAVKRGSLKNAIKLNCLCCTDFEVSEIKLCEIKDCPLWNFRPYK